MNEGDAMVLKNTISLVGKLLIFSEGTQCITRSEVLNISLLNLKKLFQVV